MCSKTVREQQQEFCNYFGFNQDIIWDRYEKDEKSDLETKINLALPLPKEEKEADKVKKVIDNIVKNLWDQRKYNGGSLLMTQIFILSVKYDDDVKLNSNSIEGIEGCTEFQVHTVFRVRKCIKEEKSHDCCMIFVDENGRVYEDWVDYKNNNQLPKAFLIAPRNGIYQSGGDNDQVFLEVIKSPACSIGRKVLKYADTGSIIGGLGATTVIIGGIVSASVFAPFIAGAAVVGGICGGYSAIRSGEKLVDRATHEQSIALDDAEARGHWFGIAAAVGSVVAGGATKVVGSMAQSGSNIGPVMRSTVNILNATAVTVNGGTVVNGFVGVYIKYKDTDKIGVLDAVQLSASLFLFTHSVYNFRTAANIIRTNQEQTVQGFRDDLSRNNKRMFDKMSKETIRTQGGSKGRAEIIRSLKNIPDKGAYFRDVYKVNKQLNQNDVKVSFSGGEEALLNNGQSVKPADLRSQLKAQPPADVFGKVGTIPESVVQNVNEHINLTNPVFGMEDSLIVKSTVSAILLANKVFSEDFLNELMVNLSKLMSDDALIVFIEFVNKFVSKFAKEIESELKRIIPFEDFLSDAFKVILKAAGKEDATDISSFIVNELKKPDIFMEISVHLARYYDKFLPKGDLDGKCKKCGGQFYINFNEK